MPDISRRGFLRGVLAVVAIAATPPVVQRLVEPAPIAVVKSQRWLTLLDAGGKECRGYQRQPIEFGPAQRGVICSKRTEFPPFTEPTTVAYISVIDGGGTELFRAPVTCGAIAVGVGHTVELAPFGMTFS